MKYFIVVSCLLAVTYGLSQEFQDKTMEKMAKIAEKCVPLVGANDEDIGELMEKKAPSRKEGKCLLACFTKEMGMTKDGKPDKDSIVASMEPLKADDPALYTKALQVVEKCAAEIGKIMMTEKDECELAAKTVACSQRIGKEVGLEDEAVMG